MTIGRIHSIETMGTVDGPGIRYVIFMQGCPMRCVFCHNRDAWDPGGGREVTVQEILRDVAQAEPFLRFSGGGVTATGGEPTLQADFVAELFRGVKAMGFNTAMDTSGFVPLEKVRDLLSVTDLILLSIKHIDPRRHQEITGVSHSPILAFMDYLREIEKPMWIRYVIIPGLTDDPKDIHALAAFLQDYPNVQLVDILPYHAMGAYKWEAMGEDYRLKGVLSPSKDQVRAVKEIFIAYGHPVHLEG